MTGLLFRVPRILDKFTLNSWIIRYIFIREKMVSEGSLTKVRAKLDFCSRKFEFCSGKS